MELQSEYGAQSEKQLADQRKELVALLDYKVRMHFAAIT
jgi:hypothetical protein